MKFTLEGDSRSNLVRSYSTEGIQIGAEFVRTSCIVTAEVLISAWAPQSFAEFTVAHVEAILALTPELVILGTGAQQHFAPAAVRALFAARMIGIEAMQLGAACRTFNVLVQEERRVAAALFVR